ncbi:hypothetical protein [Photobacterium leiognathi]|uniref:hypothetical protein n=1 Tax=Photobacterium leiognathi TaxID=553611 RepID=UPI00273A08B3|nr:hypothetical protein [Photobacterium leiognathi]
MRIYPLIFILSSIAPTASVAAPPFPICNIISLNQHHQVAGDGGYCIETKDPQVTFVNLSSKNIEVINLNNNSFFIYNNEYLITKGRFVVNNAKGVIIGKEQNGIVIARDYNSDSIKQRALPLAVWVPSAIGGGILGGMGVVASNPNANFRQVSIGMFSGALGGALGPIMGAGQFGVVAGGAIGISVGGGCSSCHQ